MGFFVAFVVNFVLKVGDVFFVAQVLLVDGSFVGLEEIPGDVQYLGLVVVLVFADVFVIRFAFVVSVAVLDIGDFGVDIFFSEGEILVGGSLVGLEELPVLADGLVLLLVGVAVVGWVGSVAFVAGTTEDVFGRLEHEVDVLLQAPILYTNTV